MGDKGGKKDKEKERKQNTEKQKQKSKTRLISSQKESLDKNHGTEVCTTAFTVRSSNDN